MDRREIHHLWRCWGYGSHADFVLASSRKRYRSTKARQKSTGIDIPGDIPKLSNSSFSTRILGGCVNKSELIDAISEGSGLNKADSEKALNAMLQTVESAVAGGDKVTIPGFGAWSQSQRSARQGRNPRTGEIVQIPASKGVKFSAGAKFKAAVK